MSRTPLLLVALLVLSLAGCATEKEKAGFDTRSGLTPEAREAQDRRAALAEGMEGKLDAAMEEKHADDGDEQGDSDDGDDGEEPRAR
jgi:hypothetical protein